MTTVNRLTGVSRIVNCCLSCLASKHASMNGLGMNGTVDHPDHLLQYKKLPPDTATQALRLQRETDFLKLVPYILYTQ